MICENLPVVNSRAAATMLEASFDLSGSLAPDCAPTACRYPQSSTRPDFASEAALGLPAPLPRQRRSITCDGDWEDSRERVGRFERRRRDRRKRGETSALRWARTLKPRPCPDNRNGHFRHAWDSDECSAWGPSCLGQPLTTATGRSRATLEAKPARWMTLTTRSTSL